MVVMIIIITMMTMTISKAELEEGLISATQFADGLSQLLEVSNDPMSLSSSSLPI